MPPQTEACDTCYNASCDKRDGSCRNAQPAWQDGLAEKWAAENHKPLELAIDPVLPTLEFSKHIEARLNQLPPLPRNETLGEYLVRTASPDPFVVQVGGEHYKGMKIQPAEFIHANGIGFLEGCIIKRACRWRGKGGVQDLEKIKHEVDLLIELERRHG